MQDLNGRPYLTRAQALIGRRVECDDDFTCMRNGTVSAIQGDQNGMWIPCRKKRHYLDGQLSACGNYYVGLYPL